MESPHSNCLIRIPYFPLLPSKVVSKQLVVVVERIAVDAAPLHNIFNGDVVQGALLQQGGEGFLDCPPCEICHGAGLLSIAYIIIACIPKKTKTGF